MTTPTPEKPTSLVSWSAGALSLEGWKVEVQRLHPTAQFTLETGGGETYGEVGDWVAHVGPDMQADVVGVFSSNDDFAEVWTADRQYPVGYTTLADSSPT